MAAQRKSSESSPVIELMFSSTGKEKPALTPKILEEFRTGLIDWIEENKDTTTAAARKCSAAYCGQVNEGIKGLGARFDYALSCKGGQRCYWAYDSFSRTWKRYCVIDCSGGGLTVKGSATLD
jgi:hypothetical protein